MIAILYQLDETDMFGLSNPSFLRLGALCSFIAGISGCSLLQDEPSYIEISLAKPTQSISASKHQEALGKAIYFEFALDIRSETNYLTQSLLDELSSDTKLVVNNYSRGQIREPEAASLTYKPAVSIGQIHSVFIAPVVGSDDNEGPLYVADGACEYRVPVKMAITIDIADAAHTLRRERYALQRDSRTHLRYRETLDVVKTVIPSNTQTCAQTPGVAAELWPLIKKSVLSFNANALSSWAPVYASPLKARLNSNQTIDYLFEIRDGSAFPENALLRSRSSILKPTLTAVTTEDAANYETISPDRRWFRGYDQHQILDQNALFVIDLSNNFDLQGSQYE